MIYLVTNNHLFFLYQYILILQDKFSLWHFHRCSDYIYACPLLSEFTSIISVSQFSLTSVWSWNINKTISSMLVSLLLWILGPSRRFFFIYKDLIVSLLFLKLDHTTFHLPWENWMSFLQYFRPNSSFSTSPVLD